MTTRQQKAFEAIGRAVMELAGLDVERVKAMVQQPETESEPVQSRGLREIKRRGLPLTVQERQQKILEYLSKTNWARCVEMARSFGTTTVDLSFPLQKLRESGRITKRGERKGARYQLVRQAEDTQRRVGNGSERE
jgi:hypothetical protein